MPQAEATLSRLHELLAFKDTQLETLSAQIGELERQLSYEVDWMLHAKMAEDARLPSPRLELQALELGDFHSQWRVALVLTECGGGLTQVPLEFSKRSGGGRIPPEEFPTEGALPPACISELSSLVYDLCWHHENMKIPAFVRIDAERLYQVTGTRPVTMVAVAPASPRAETA